MPSILLSDNGVSSGSAGLKSTAASDGALALQTTTAGGTATTAVTIDTSQNVGLGVTPSAWTTNTKALQFTDASSTLTGSLSAVNGTFGINSNSYYGSSGGTSWKYVGTGAAAIYWQESGSHRWGIAGSGTAGNAITFTQAMTLSGGGSTDTNLQLLNQTNNYATLLTLAANNDNGAIYNYIRSTTNGGTEHWKISGGGAASTMVFSTGGTERARITSDGSFGLSPAASANPKMVLNASNNTIAISFNSAGVSRGNIYFLDSGVSYNTTSDYRLKDNVQPMTGALAKVAALKPVTYTWNINGADGEGFIAHELAEVCPHAVTGEKDAVETYTDEEGNEQTRPVYQGIDTSYLVATLTAAIQELKAIVDAQAAEIAALKGTQP